MLPLRLFAKRAFSAATIIGFAINFTLYGAIFVLGLYFQRLHGYSPLQTGLAFLPLCAGLGVSNIAAGRITARFGPWLPICSGLVLAAVGCFVLTQLDAQTSYLAMLPGLLVAPLGIGLAVPAMTNVLLGSVERESSGIASGVLNTARQSGGALGVAVLGSLLAAHAVAGMRVGFVLAALMLIVVLAVAMASREAALRLRSG